MSTEKIIKSKSGWLFLLITIALFAVAALFGKFCTQRYRCRQKSSPGSIVP